MQLVYSYEATWEHNAEFRNQTFPAFIIEYKDNFIHKNFEGSNHKKEDKQAILIKFNNKYNECKKKLKLIALKLLQVVAVIMMTICKYYVGVATKIKQNLSKKMDLICVIETKSSFNNHVQEIMGDDLSHRYAFIEHLKFLLQ